jgi:glycine cleavage system T protein (aminomethyltransferase)
MALARTQLFDTHVAAGARMVDFGGWEMPLHYGSQIEEHNAVRSAAGMFDVSHMTIIDLDGPGAFAYLRNLTANDPAKLTDVGHAQYGVLLNDKGGVVDDLIVYRRANCWRAVVNAATRAKVLAWFKQHATGFDVNIKHRGDLAMIAVQGPEAIERFEQVTDLTGTAEMKPFKALERGEWMVARTGYTGEEGVEVMLPAAEGIALWKNLADARVAPCGLASRDTLRLEAGLNLYGQDMDETNDPLESNLAWTVALDPADRDFVGRAAVEARKAAGVPRKLTGVVLDAKGVIRHGQRIITDAGEGEVTSGIFSPTLGYSIALARLPRAAKGTAQVDIRGKLLPCRIVRPPFVRNGKKVFE